ncbi:MAG: hypothetical protein NT018_12910 [Armatimonadetes bacterium]|nr:hypothetical protein [Armatimonadota bacterium]
MKSLLVILRMAALAVLLCSSVCAEKIAVDPYKNGGSTASREEPGPDLRLAQKITYTSTEKRLHTVLEEITKKTGVDIKCGINADDWHVRDIPLVVCVKNLPLGKLLRAIADATHLALSTSTVKGVRRYRIWRDPARQNQLAAYFKNLEEAKNTTLNNQWDAWATLKQKGFSAMSYGDSEEEKSKSVMLQSAADVMSALPAGSKEAVMSGKLLSFDIKSSPSRLAQALKSYFQNLGIYAKDSYEADHSEIFAEDGSSYRPEPPRDLTEADMEKMRFTVGSQRSYFDSMVMVPGLFDLDSLSGLYMGLDSDSMLATDGLYPPFSGDEAFSKLHEDDPADALEPPSTDYSRTMTKLDDEHRAITGMDGKFKIPKPKEDMQQTFADLVVDIAEASGFSIVCEDFHSHAMSNIVDCFGLYDKETTLRALLVAPPEESDSAESSDAVLNEDGSAVASKAGSKTEPELDSKAGVTDAFSSDHWVSDTDWFADTSAKLVVGWHSAWWDQHKALAPEKLIAGLISKMNGDGLEIDDVASTLLLPNDQYAEWILNHRDLGGPFFFRMAVSNLDFWKIYAELSAKNKALAKSKDGLPLANLPRASVLTAFSKSAEMMGKTGDLGTLVMMHNWRASRPEMEQRMQAWRMQNIPQMSDPESANAGLTIEEQVRSLLEAFPEMKSALEPPPTDPAKILGLKMRLVRVDLSGSKAAMLVRIPLGEGKKKPHTYRLTFEGDGITVDAGSLGQIYPLYSEKRANEFIEEQKKQSEKKEPK